ncbi:histidine kinase [Paenibacillus sp. LHD-117]|uniref:sensor histidine kinase n=1 Tax=Paenibacillus sp. LHD-117 TaxID=3071412 RepID=UPI0027DF8338|nr:GAF domain-containing protein [Paenibacillus sp. LHD-117]MDQ6418745.1 histidine kinase [Paenibacillus sp. LHD-117]
MERFSHIQELTTLKIIAETLNQSTDVFTMLDEVLGKLLELTGLTYGWIFLIEDNQENVLAAHRNLPPGLLNQEMKLMHAGSCWCVDQYRDGRLNSAVNIMSCRRLDTAKRTGSGDTCGFTHHATVPLMIGDRKFGILNVGSLGKNHFEQEELALLASVALQIGVGVERMRLHKVEQRRADLFTRLGEFSRRLSQSVSTGISRIELAENAAMLISRIFDWPGVALLEKVGDQYHAQSLIASGISVPEPAAAKLKTSLHGPLIALTGGEQYREITAAAAESIVQQWHPLQERNERIKSLLAVSLASNARTTNQVLLVGRNKPQFLAKVEGEVLEAIASHIAVALEHAQLEENRRELVRTEERNRLARDLHDSVSQLLFSISMTAKGAEACLLESDTAAAGAAIADMHAMSKEALKEMRSLIQHLRPANLDGGLTAALIDYGKRLGLQVKVHRGSGYACLPSHVNETLWRIGQEALNNVAKHAATDQVDIAFSVHGGELNFVIQDDGRGLNQERSGTAGHRPSFGLAIMQERAESLGGRLKLSSPAGSGTLIEAVIPMPTGTPLGGER